MRRLWRLWTWIKFRAFYALYFGKLDALVSRGTLAALRSRHYAQFLLYRDLWMKERMYD